VGTIDERPTSGRIQLPVEESTVSGPIAVTGIGCLFPFAVPELVTEEIATFPSGSLLLGGDGMYDVVINDRNLRGALPIDRLVQVVVREVIDVPEEVEEGL
jgi:hypothetical protein